MSHIVVLGAGLGGVIMAYEMKEKMGPNDELTVVNLGSSYSFVPSNPWVAVGWRERKDISRRSARHLRQARHRAAARRAPSACTPRKTGIELNDGSSLDYDYLVIATGPELAFDEIEGLGPDANTQSVCQIDHAREGQGRLRRAGQAAGPDRRRRGAGRLLLRPGLRIRLHSRHGAAPRPQARPGADDLRHPGTLYRPSRPRRRRRHQGPARERHARAAHQVDHQRQGEEGRSRQDVRRGGRRGRRHQGRRTSCPSPIR